MSVEGHRLATELLGRGEAYLRAGDESAARTLFAEAAELEVRALATIPDDRQRTRAVIAISAVSLYARAGRDSHAMNLAARFLTQAELPDDLRRELVDLIVTSERRRELEPERRVDAGDLFEVVLRGEDVYVGGVVRLETALLKMQQFHHYLVRVGEYVLRKPFRPRGVPTDEVTEALIPIIGPATVGSYRFELGIVVASEQLTLQRAPRIDSERIATEAFGILEATVEAPERLGDRVEEPHYREWFTKAIRGLAPTGRGLNQVEIVRRRTRDSTLLVPESYRRLSRQVRLMRPARPVGTDEREGTLTGVLRALNLDEQWLKVVEDGREIRCRIGQGMFDDVIGPYVNHKVALSVIRGRGGSVEVLDIAEANE